MRVFLALILFSSSPAPAAPPLAESHAIGRVLRRLWPTGDGPTQTKLTARLADDVHRGRSDDHRQQIFNDAEITAELTRRALESRRRGGPGLGEEDFGRLIVALVNGYQVAAAERFDEVNGATCATAAVLAGGLMVPFCLALGLDGALLTNDTPLDVMLASSIGLWLLFASIGTTYGLIGGDDLGRKLPALPGMRTVATKWPGNDHLMFFWDTIDQRLAAEPEWVALRGGEPLRANEHLEHFATLLGQIAPDGLVPDACQKLLGN